MIKELRFFKQDGKWYADVPNHDLADNEMVFGADAILESLAIDKDEVKIILSDSMVSDYLLRLVQTEHDNDGAWYEFNGPLYAAVMAGMIEFGDLSENKIWICNVTHDVFGEHPKEIYILKIDR